VTQGNDFIVIEPAPLRQTMVRSYADHRMAMSFAVLGMAAGKVAIEDPACVAKTYPTFWEDVAACYRTTGGGVPW
jgi:3-phosphoshikimate 1-carboxyvinyltransferase